MQTTLLQIKKAIFLFLPLISLMPNLSNAIPISPTFYYYDQHYKNLKFNNYMESAQKYNAEMQAQYDKCVAAAVARGQGGCNNHQGIDVSIKENTNHINGLPSEYLVKAVLTTYSLINGKVTIQEAQANNWPVMMKIQCPAGTTTRELNGRWYCDCPDISQCPVDNSSGPPPMCGTGGTNPINITNGNKYQVEMDYVGGATGELKFFRTYNSRDGLWRHNYSTHLRLAGTTASLVFEHGRESFFWINTPIATSMPTELGRLITTPTGWTYYAHSNERYEFDQQGRLVVQISQDGKRQQLSYSQAAVTVSDELGRSLTFTEDAYHQPLSLQTEEFQVAYQYNANQRLTQLTRTQSGQVEQRSYHYEVAGNDRLLTGITDERGVRFATWTYDDKGRATSSEHAGGAERTLVTYNTNGTTTVTNPLGKRADYHFQIVDGTKLVNLIVGQPSANCKYAYSRFTYNPRGLLSSHIDRRNQVTNYTYNDRGLEVSRTEADGTPQSRTITTTWHPTLNLPLTVTEPDRITTYRYDDQGRQLSQSVSQR
ncbi:RHS repeat protein [Pseudomonas otitidis]|uniref:RHS repeat protein n=1 Tax=Metapseudomonas otitidis TaxID=319939 RepID=A0A7X3H3N8_9GAMM|nr:DUF6531 domain-containing protein [Pseudomonas otitidis]MWK54776.1 RHS repeat protein [Pseudomonas otitidis]